MQLQKSIKNICSKKHQHQTPSVNLAQCQWVDLGYLPKVPKKPKTFFNPLNDLCVDRPLFQQLLLKILTRVLNLIVQKKINDHINKMIL